MNARWILVPLSAVEALSALDVPSLQRPTSMSSFIPLKSNPIVFLSKYLFATSATLLTSELLSLDLPIPHHLHPGLLHNR